MKLIMKNGLGEMLMKMENLHLVFFRHMKMEFILQLLMLETIIKHHEIIYDLKSGDRKSYNFTVSKKPTIKEKY